LRYAERGKSPRSPLQEDPARFLHDIQTPDAGAYQDAGPIGGFSIQHQSGVFHRTARGNDAEPDKRFGSAKFLYVKMILVNEIPDLARNLGGEWGGIEISNRPDPGFTVEEATPELLVIAPQR
jgi:hypothetical protein